MRFSIITITYNHLAGLKRTAESVKAQIYTDHEWIIIDGDSCDGTHLFLNTLDAVIISGPDQGIYDAMNKGLDIAKGEYILFLNAGDIFASSDVLENIHQVVSKSKIPIDFLYSDAYERQENGIKNLKTVRPLKAYKKGMITHHQAMLYRRKKLAGLKYDIKYKIAADYKFTCEFIQRIESSYFFHLPICCFEAGGISQRKTSLARKEQYIIRREMRICSFWENILIYYIQLCTLTLRRLCPRFYWFLRTNLVSGK